MPTSYLDDFQNSDANEKFNKMFFEVNLLMQFLHNYNYRTIIVQIINKTLANGCDSVGRAVRSLNPIIGKISNSALLKRWKRGREWSTKKVLLPTVMLSLSLSLWSAGVFENKQQASTPVSFSDFVCQENIWINKKYCFKTTQIVNPNEV